MKILKYKANETPSALKGSFSLELPTGMVINDCRYFVKADSRWIAMPQRQYEKDGEKRYYNLVTFNTPTEIKEFNGKVLEVLDAHLKEDTSPEMPF